MATRKKPSRTLKARVEIEKLNEKVIQAERARDEARLERDRSLARMRIVEKELRDLQGVRQFVFGLAGDPVQNPGWTAQPGRSHTSEHIPILVTSDFQWGEVVDQGRMGGVNEYNVSIAQERYQRLIERTIDISFNHLPNNEYKGIIVLRLGDMVNGDIHEDLAKSNELAAVPAVRSLVSSERAGLEQLADSFGRVHVVSVPGNHGRTTKKPESKAGAVDNYDTLSAWWLESEFRNDDRLTFHTPESGDALFTVYGRRYLATHGDRIGSRGGQGFIGPAATIMRGMKRVHDTYAQMGLPLQLMFIGHFHKAYDLGYGFSNGSMPGYGEYARDGRLTPEPPLQWLLFFHPKYGVTSQWKVRLSPDPTVPDLEVLRPFEVEA